MSGVVSSHAEMVVPPEQTVSTLREKIAASHTIPYPDPKLALRGEPMSLDRSLGSYQLKSGDTVDFIVQLSEPILAEQLAGFVRSRALTADELGLLYCYKYGVSANHALQLIGLDLKLADFLGNNKTFAVNEAKVTLAADATPATPAKSCDSETRGIAEDLAELLEKGSCTVAVLCAKYRAKHGKTVASVAGVRPQELLASDGRFAVNKLGLVELRKPEPELCQEGLVHDDGMYEALAEKIAPRGFSSRHAQHLAEARSVLERSSVRLQRVAKGGSVVKGTAIIGSEDTELVAFVKMPTDCSWQKPLARTIHGLLESSGAKLRDGHLQLGAATVALVPDISCQAAAAWMRGKTGAERALIDPVFTPERTAFVAKQPPRVRTVLRLLKWWREQQSWSCDLTRPSDYLLEVLGIYAAASSGDAGLAQLVANCMALLSKFAGLRVVWSQHYRPAEVWPPLLDQRPLLMDPVSPLKNLADPQDFDPREMVKYAATSHFFY